MMRSDRERLEVAKYNRERLRVFLIEDLRGRKRTKFRGDEKRKKERAEGNFAVKIAWKGNWKIVEGKVGDLKAHCSM